MTMDYFITFPLYERPINAIVGLLLWLKFLYFLRIFRQTGHFISMIIDVIADMKVFMGVFFVVIIAFGNAFFILSNNNPADDRFIVSIPDSLLWSYNLSLGAFDTEAMGSKHFELAAVLFFISSIFLIIIMLNFLVAVISDTYARIQESQMNQMYQNLADLIIENQGLCKKSDLDELDNKGDYIYLSFLQDLDCDEDEMEVEIDNLRELVQNKTTSVENLIKKIAYDMGEAQKANNESIS